MQPEIGAKMFPFLHDVFSDNFSPQWSPAILNSAYCLYLTVWYLPNSAK